MDEKGMSMNGKGIRNLAEIVSRINVGRGNIRDHNEFCDFCGKRFARSHPRQRFCKPECHKAYHNAEARDALYWYRRHLDETG
jgi:hypothetical protein